MFTFVGVTFTTLMDHHQLWIYDALEFKSQGIPSLLGSFDRDICKESVDSSRECHVSYVTSTKELVVMINLIMMATIGNRQYIGGCLCQLLLASCGRNRTKSVSAALSDSGKMRELSQVIDFLGLHNLSPRYSEQC